MVVADHRRSSWADGIVEFSRARRLRHGRRSGGLAGEEASDITDRAHQRGREHHRGVLVHPQLDQSLQIAQAARSETRRLMSTARFVLSRGSRCRLAGLSRRDALLHTRRRELRCGVPLCAGSRCPSGDLLAEVWS